jgi:hypothetical protein
MNKLNKKISLLLILAILLFTSTNTLYASNNTLLAQTQGVFKSIYCSIKGIFGSSCVKDTLETNTNVSNTNTPAKEEEIISQEIILNNNTRREIEEPKDNDETSSDNRTNTNTTHVLNNNNNTRPQTITVAGITSDELERRLVQFRQELGANTNTIIREVRTVSGGGGVSSNSLRNSIDNATTGGSTNFNGESLTVSGNVTANQFVGDGSLLSGIDLTLNSFTTTDLAEGTNLYFTNTRAINALTGQDISLFNNDVGYLTNLSSFTTSNLAEGTNLYFTDARARQSLCAGTGITYDLSTGQISAASSDLNNLSTVAVGNSNLDSGTQSSAFGYQNTASGYRSSALGYNNTSSGTNSSAFGYANTSSALNSVSMGRSNFSGSGGLASVNIGLLNNATGTTLNTTTGVITGTATACTTVGRLTTTIGIRNNNCGAVSVAIGYNNTISGDYSVAIGNGNIASNGGVAYGRGNCATGLITSSFGWLNTASGYRSSTLGYCNSSSATGCWGTASGYVNSVTQCFANAFGSRNCASGIRSAVFGHCSSASATDATTFGGFLANSTTCSTIIGPRTASSLHICCSGETTTAFKFCGIADGSLSLSGGVLTSSSDQRLKDIQGEYTSSLDQILGLNPILYKWKENTPYDTETIYAGFSAQNVGEFIPEAISTGPNGMLGLNDRPIVATLVNAVKELNNKIDALSKGFLGWLKFNNNEMCVDDVCISKEDFKQMILNNKSVNNNQNNSSNTLSGGGSVYNNQDQEETSELNDDLEENSLENSDSGNDSNEIVEEQTEQEQPAQETSVENNNSEDSPTEEDQINTN